MAKKRMFSLDVIDTDKFLEMPTSTRLLYYDLGMRADDDGFLGGFKKITKMTGASEDDIKLLIAKNYIIPFENGVIVIKHWRLNNYIQSDRYNKTIYQEEMGSLALENNNVYTLDTQCIHRLDKTRLDKISLDKISIDTTTTKDNQNIVSIVEENFGRLLSSFEIEKIYLWLQLPFEKKEIEKIILLALEISVLNGKKTFSYINGILNNWLGYNLTTVEQIKKTINKKNVIKNEKNIPEWFDKEIIEELATEEEIKEFENGLTK